VTWLGTLFVTKPVLCPAAVFQLKVHNDFDPVHSRETSAFVLKSSKEVSP